MPNPEFVNQVELDSNKELSRDISKERGSMTLDVAKRDALMKERELLLAKRAKIEEEIAILRRLSAIQSEENKYNNPNSKLEESPQTDESEDVEEDVKEDVDENVDENNSPEAPRRAKIEYILKKSNKNVAFRNLISGVAVVAVASILGASIPTNGFGLLNKDRARQSVPTESPAIVQTIEDETTTEASGNFEPAGYVTLKNGDRFQCYTYSGGYHSETDPYVTKFDYQNEADYENDDAYGYQIAGDTSAEKTSNWIKRVMLSSEAIVMLRVQMGLEDLNSMEQVNARANALRTMTSEEYDRIANETAEAFYDALEDGSIEESKNWVLENYMNDEMAGSHEDSVVHGRYNGDDERGKEGADLLLTFYDADGNNIVSSEQGFLNTKQDAGDNGQVIGQKAWVNMDEGGTWKWKAGKKTPAPTPTAEPTPTPETPTPETPTPETPTPETPTPTPETPTPTPETPTPTPTPLATKDPSQETEHAGPRVNPTGLDESVTPPTKQEEDQANFDDMERQRQEDEARRQEAERIRREQEEAERQAAAEAEARRAAEEAARKEAEEKAAAEEAERQRKAEEAARQAAEQAAREQAAAEEAERQRQAEEAARQEAQRRADEEAAANAAESAGNAGASASERAGMDY